ncbi:ABC transporter substrate-binding protein [Streptomyces olivaceoviridis]|uniref:ABC transporter substrate-binding protein n=1 Tax=Streptomyces olivaceoviridis TaxID=1921 RepID=UPI0037B82A83
MKNRKLAPVLLVAAGLVAALLTGCGVGMEGNSPRLVVGMSDSVLSVDPASGYDPGSWVVFNNVFQSLLSFPRGSTEPQPEAAQECSFIDKSTEVYKCKLKDGLKFSNGDPLNSDDVKFTFDRMLKINDPNGPAVMFQVLRRVETPDRRTVVFRLKSPDATFPSKIASGAGSIVSRRQYDPDSLRQDTRAIGSGPYKLDSFDNREAVFSVNENYKGTAKVNNKGVVLRFFNGDQVAFKRALLHGDVDVAYRGLQAPDIADIDLHGKKQGLDVVEGTGVEVQHLVFNLKDPVVGHLAVRKAIAYLLDRDDLMKSVYHDTAVPLYSTIPTGIVGHSAAFFDLYGSTPSKKAAAEALANAGFLGKVKLTLWSTPTRYGPSTDAELAGIAQQLNASGLFRADVKSVKFEQYEKDILADKYGVYVKAWVPDYPDADNFTAPFFGPGNVLNNHYQNSTVTKKIIPSTAAERDRRRTEDQYRRLQTIVAEDLPVLPVWQSKQYMVVKSTVRGYAYCLDASTVFRFWELYNT